MRFHWFRIAWLAALAPFPVAAADDFAEFRIPPNRVFSWTAALRGTGSQHDVGYLREESSSGGLGSNLEGNLLWLSDSDPAFTSASAGARLFGNRTRSTSTLEPLPPFQTVWTSTETRATSLNESVSLGFSHRRYPSRSAIGLEGTLSLSGDYSQRWSTNLTTQQSPDFQSSDSDHREWWSYAHGIETGLALGWGRVRNATGVYDALLLERRLIETGALLRPLSKPARGRLAELMYVRGAMDAVRERPGRTLWREIERILREDGALREGGLDPFSVLRAMEPHIGGFKSNTLDGVPFSPVPRLRGVFIGPRLVDRHAHVLLRTDRDLLHQTVTGGTPTTYRSTTAYRSTLSEDDVEAGLTGEFHRPAGSRWQIDASADVLLGVRKEDNHLALSSSVSVAWLLADRWIVTANGLHRWHDDERTHGPTGRDLAISEGGTSVTWYLEDHAAVTLAVFERQQWVRGGAEAFSGLSYYYPFVRDVQVSMDFTYRFAGWFETPGFFPPIDAGP